MDTEWRTEGTTKCANCKVIIDEDDEALQCELCEFWFHTECQNINKSTYNFLVKNAKSREKTIVSTGIANVVIVKLTKY